ncbi:MAG: undecaprenyldiphospho-muramoylpentapeptide beta-N-acetylglucosaminyltransferase [Anaerorhabdus sp.]
MKVIITTGGTGGHIYPALSLANEIKLDNKENEIIFLGSLNRMEKDIVPEYGYPFYGLDIVATKGSVFNKFISIIKLFKSYFKCKKIIKNIKPDIVIGFGNYISVPVVMAANKLKIKTLIHEQNSVPGKANLFLSRYVDRVIGSYNENKDFFKCEVSILGNPRSSDAGKVKKNKIILEQFGLSTNKKTVIFVMGSLGSQSVNKVLKQIIPEINDRQYQALIVTGKKDYLNFVSGIENFDNVKIVEYIDGINVMKQADLLVVRGGATTAAEVVAMSIPAIIIPSPYVPYDHQTTNALALKNAGCAYIIEEKNLDSIMLVKKIDEIINDDERLKNMKKSSKKISHHDASNEIVKVVKELVYESD